jgi:COP9 signalosome complex subunit 7
VRCQHWASDQFKLQSWHFPGQENPPKISAKQEKKLKLLSLLPLSSSHATLTYAHLLTALDLPTTRALEELITTAIYTGLITATLDPAHSLISVTSVAPLRDLAPGSLPALQSALQSWSQRCEAALADLASQVERVKKEAVDREKVRRKRERAIEAMVAAGEDKPASKRGGGTAIDDIMDIDDDSGSRTTRGSKKGHGSFGFGGGRRLGWEDGCWWMARSMMDMDIHGQRDEDVTTSCTCYELYMERTEGYAASQESQSLVWPHTMIQGEHE